MNPDAPTFDERYVSAGTARTEETDLLAVPERPPAVVSSRTDVPEEKYGVAKPQRVFVRARIIHDQD
jgi:hypothetical protein